MKLDYSAHAAQMKNDFDKLKATISDRWSDMYVAWETTDKNVTRPPWEILEKRLADLQELVKRITA